MNRRIWRQSRRRRRRLRRWRKWRQRRRRGRRRQRRQRRWRRWKRRRQGQAKKPLEVRSNLPMWEKDFELDSWRPWKRRCCHNGWSIVYLGNHLFFFGWKFCSKHVNDFADHMCLVETNEAEKRRRLKAIYDNKDPHSLTRFVWKHLDWFEPEENLWLYGDKKGLKIDSVELPYRKGKKK